MNKHLSIGKEVNQARRFGIKQVHRLMLNLEQSKRSAAGVLPEVFRSPEVLAATLSLKAYAARVPKLHCLELTDCEYLHLRSAVEHDRNRDIKAMRKGLCSPDDLQGHG